MSSIRYWVWLSSVSAANPRARFALAEHYGDAEKAFHAPSGELKSIQGLSAFEAEQFERRDLREADRILETCRRENISILTIADTAYPQRLRNIYDPPVVLYIKGRLPDVDAIPSVAVIGTRSATPYGLKMGRDIAFEIAKCGGIVVSGLTEGIDRAAARGCLLAGGTCIGVLGTAHGRDGELREDVAATGALVSEYPPGAKTQNRFFRERNRIAAGISDGVVVVEAPEKSGTRLFVNDAVDQGKDVFAVPGNADAENAVGTLALLKDGAKLVTCGAEVMEDYVLRYPDCIDLNPELEERTDRAEKEPERTEKTGEGKTSGDVPAAPDFAEAQDADAAEQALRARLSVLTEDQLKIISAIDPGSTHIDDITERTGLSTSRVLAQLTVLEIKGFVRRETGRRFALNITVEK